MVERREYGLIHVFVCVCVDGSEGVEEGAEGGHLLRL